MEKLLMDLRVVGLSSCYPMQLNVPIPFLPFPGLIMEFETAEALKTGNAVYLRVETVKWSGANNIYVDCTRVNAHNYTMDEVAYESDDQFVERLRRSHKHGWQLL